LVANWSPDGPLRQRDSRCRWTCTLNTELSENPQQIRSYFRAVRAFMRLFPSALAGGDSAPFPERHMHRRARGVPRTPYVVGGRQLINVFKMRTWRSFDLLENGRIRANKQKAPSCLWKAERSKKVELKSPRISRCCLIRVAVELAVCPSVCLRYARASDVSLAINKDAGLTLLRSDRHRVIPINLALDQGALCHARISTGEKPCCETPEVCFIERTMDGLTNCGDE